LRPLLFGERLDLRGDDLDQPRLERIPVLGLRKPHDLALLRHGFGDLGLARPRGGGDALDLLDDDLCVGESGPGHSDDEGDLVAVLGSDASDDHRTFAVPEQPDARGVDPIRDREMAHSGGHVVGQVRRGGALEVAGGGCDAALVEAEDRDAMAGEVIREPAEGPVAGSGGVPAVAILGAAAEYDPRR
jgi:hypothetical protein